MDVSDDIEISALTQQTQHFDIALGQTGATPPGELLLDPEALMNGSVLLRFDGLSEAENLRLTLAYDPQALTPVSVSPLADAANASFRVDPGRAEIEVSITDIPLLVAQLAAVAALSFQRVPNGKRTGTLKLKGLEIDGADVPLDAEVTDWTGAAPGGYTLAQTPLAGGLSVPMLGRATQAPDR
ncbi:hypothetical protein ACS3SW_06505 [Roseobacteraceae bacterium S113]